jgi:hypothetical protein
MDSGQPVPVHKAQPGNGLLQFPLAYLLKDRSRLRVGIDGHATAQPTVLSPAKW